MTDAANADIARWNTVADRLQAIIQEPAAELQKRRDWLSQYVKQGGGVTHAAAGEALAATLITAAILGMPDGMLRRLSENIQTSKGRECFRHDFARCLIVKLNHQILSNPSDIQASPFTAMDDGEFLASVLSLMAGEAGALMDAFGLPTE